MNQQPPAPAWQTPPEQAGPAPGVQFAPHGERLVAYVIDAFILFIVIIVIAIVLAGGILAGSDFSDPRAPQIAPLGVVSSVLIVVLILVLTLGYFPFFWARGGQTPGMKPFGLYVVRDVDGGRLTTGQAIMRLVGYWINGIVLYIGFAWVLIDARRRGWHDLIAGTVVVKR